MESISSELLKIAAWQTSKGPSDEKKGFVPAGAAMAGGMGMGAPAPPGLPGAPGAVGPMPPVPPVGPMDPMGGMGIDPAMLEAAMGGGGAAPPMPPMPAEPPPTPPPETPPEAPPEATASKTEGSAKKIDPALIYAELINMRKLIATMFSRLDWEIPPDMLQNTEIGRAIAQGESLPAAAAATPPAAPPAPEPPMPAPPTPGPEAAPPMEPMPAKQATDASLADKLEAMPSEVMGTKYGERNPSTTLADKLDAVAALSRSLAARPSNNDVHIEAQNNMHLLAANERA